MQLAEAYFDESGSHDGSPVLCVAGYIIEKETCVSLDSEWADVLDKFGLPFFRMSACAHGTTPFNALSREDRILAEKAMIDIMKRSVAYGIAVTVEPKKYDEIMPLLPETGSAYSFCAHTCLSAVKSWADKNSFTGDIAYFFESGHRSQSEANDIMNRLFKNPELRASHRYASHTFADKQKVRPLQAADLIAWQWFTDHKRRMEGRSPAPRADCFELMMAGQLGDSKYHTLHYSEALLRQMAERVMSRRYPNTYPWGSV